MEGRPALLEAKSKWEKKAAIFYILQYRDGLVYQKPNPRDRQFPSTDLAWNIWICTWLPSDPMNILQQVLAGQQLLCYFNQYQIISPHFLQAGSFGSLSRWNMFSIGVWSIPWLEIQYAIKLHNSAIDELMSSDKSGQGQGVIPFPS